MAQHNFINMTGVQYGNFTVIEIDEEKTNGTNRERVFWLCQCSCGNVKSIDGRQIRNKKARTNCGCIKTKQKKKRETIYTGMDATLIEQQKRLRKIHASMIERCHNKKHKFYYNYGGKGVVVVEHWHNKQNFVDDMLESYLEFERVHGIHTATIDRIDNNKGYNKENCRWATMKQQQNNKSINIPVTVNGKYYPSITMLVEDYPEFKVHTLIYRHNHGWADDELLLPLHTNIIKYREQKQNNPK